jgi:predicted MFS family arabinose efflux permease
MRLLSCMSFVPNIASLLVLRFFEGAAHILAISTLMAIAAGWAGEARRGRTMGIIGSAMMFGTACGTRLGGEIWRCWPDWTFQIAGTLSAAASLGAMLFVAESSDGYPKKGGLAKVFSLVGDHVGW